MIQTYSELKYEKLNNLRTAMNRASSLHNYDFSEQLAGDYIALVLSQMEQEILFSGKSRNELKKNLKARSQNQLFSDALLKVNYAKFNKKFRSYLFLLKYKLYGLFITIRRLKKVK